MIFHSPDPDGAIPEISLSPFVLRRASRLGGKSALIDGLSGRTITYSQLAARVRHTAKSLVQRGYRKGDVFAIYSPNSPEYAIAFHAIATIGGIVTTADPFSPADELAHQLNDASAKCLITTSYLLDAAMTAASGSKVREVFTFDQAEGALPFAELFESVMAPTEVPTNALIDPRTDLVERFYTNGAAGKPSCVTRTHYGYVADLSRLVADAPLDDEEVFIAAPPVFHSHGMMMTLNHALLQGVTIVTLPRSEPEKLSQTIEKYAVKRAPIVANGDGGLCLPMSGLPREVKLS